MKCKGMPVVSLVLALCLLCGCAAAGAVGPAPNPMTEFDTYEELCAAAPGMTLFPAPEGAENISYATIDAEVLIAQVEFSWMGDDYTMRAASAPDQDASEDIHGVMGDFEHDMDKDELGLALSYPASVKDLELEYNDEDGMALLSWYDGLGQTRHTLFSETAGKPEMRILKLLEEYPAYLGAAKE